MYFFYKTVYVFAQFQINHVTFFRSNSFDFSILKLHLQVIVRVYKDDMFFYSNRCNRH